MNRLLGLSLAALALAVGPVPQPQTAAPAAGGTRRVVYVTATDSANTPVADLVASDFAVKEGGKAREVVDARIATVPIQLAIIVDDNGTGLFRFGLLRFVERLDGRAEFAVSSVVGQTFKVVDYTSNTSEVQRGIATLSARPGTPDGGQLLEGIYESARELRRREAARPVIVALTVGGEEHSTVEADHVLNELRQSGASLNVISVASSALRTTRPVGRASALLEEGYSLAEVLGDGPKQSGGRMNEIVAAPGIVADLQQLADELLNQYRIEYLLPPGVKPSDRLNVSLKRGGVSLRAPTKIPK